MGMRLGMEQGEVVEMSESSRLTRRDRKCIVSHPVGTDHIDIEYCRQHNIQVMNCTGCNTETVAEHALSLVRLPGQRLSDRS